ncbi:substrate-binding periplasmic protein [Zooshikella sp. RANM57]|uniref:substrate-binding periplasmic protein n=1 Tax=Zooshikella sp. RANM57 TaxID=3425863 RepID=UPI003D6F8DC0
MKMGYRLLNRWCIVLLSVGYSITSMAETTVLIATGEYQPWASESLKHKGFVSHVIDEAFKRAGDYKVEFKFLPWKRAYESAKKGDYHATSFWFHSADREHDFIYSTPVMSEKTVFFHLKTNPLKAWHKLTDLSDRTIGATIGYTYTKEFWDLAKSGKLQVQTASADDKNFKKLFASRIDLFPMGTVAGFGLLAEKFDQSVVHLIDFNPKPLVEAKGHLLFSRKHTGSEQLVKDFNKGIKQLQSEGLLDKWREDLLVGAYKK